MLSMWADKCVLKYSSTKVLSLSLSIKLDNHLILHVWCSTALAKMPKIWGVTGVHALYMYIGPCNLSTYANK